MLNDLEDLEVINDDLEEKIIEIDYTETTLKVRKKLLRKIWVVFVSSTIILITFLVDKHDDFDVVLKSDLFRAVLVITIALSIVILIFSYNSRHIYNDHGIYKKHKSFLDVMELLSIVPIFMALLTLLNVFMISPSYIDGASMEPTYYHGDDILFWHLNVKYERYDVVILEAPSGNYWIKRIIGLPGDTIVLDNGVVYVNGFEIDQFFLEDDNGSIDDYTICRVGDPDYCEFNVSEGQYFVLGDNRSVSDDSRSNTLGYVSEEKLFGKVIFKFNNFLRN
jgi:signal peptidase I